MTDAPNTNDKARIDVDVPELPVMVHAQYVKDFSFENPNALNSLRPSKSRPEMDINIMLDASRVTDDQNPDLYESSLSITVRATRDNTVLFITEIVYAALVTLKDAPAERINPILFIDIPQMIFPFARQIISNATASGGFPPLQLNPVDFRSMYLSQRREQKQALDVVAGNA